VHEVDGAEVETIKLLELPSAWESGQPDLDDE